MQINKIQDNTKFGAKINIIGNIIEKSAMAKFAEKANKIGTEKDIIEFRFKDLELKKKFEYKKNFVPDIVEQDLVEGFKARLIKNGIGRGIMKARDKFYADSYIDLRKIEENRIDEYLDKLINHYAS